MNPFPTIGRHLTRTLALVAGVGVADQLSKWYMAEHLLTDNNTPLTTWLSRGQDVDFSATGAHGIALAPFLDLTLVWNRGVSFGIGAGSIAPAAFVAFAVLAGLLLFVWAARTEARFLSAALALISGGALSNAYDRLRFGAVIDFIDAHIGDLHWPAFNIADSCIVLGAVFVMLDTFISERKASSHETAK